jgi:hypothetical protein
VLGAGMARAAGGGGRTNRLRPKGSVTVFSPKEPAV